MKSQLIIDHIRDSNPNRSFECLRRRLLKILEELGEGCEAYLSTTGSNNYKQKTWSDYREEGCDTLIVMVDVALTALPESNWPPETYLYLHIDEGRSNAATNFDDMEAIKFDIARAVCSADYFLRQPDGATGFYGALARGVKSAARLCYARVPETDSDNIDEEIFATIQRKLAKWMGKSTAKTARVKPTVNEVIDAETFYEELRERHQ